MVSFADNGFINVVHKPADRHETVTPFVNLTRQSILLRSSQRFPLKKALREQATFEQLAPLFNNLSLRPAWCCSMIEVQYNVIVITHKWRKQQYRWQRSLLVLTNNLQSIVCDVHNCYQYARPDHREKRDVRNEKHNGNKRWHQGIPISSLILA